MLQPRSWACPFGMFLLLGLGAPAAHALEPNQTFGMYGYDVWGVKQGLPQANVTSIAQTPDGYLWLATPRGLVRFDGVRFVLMDLDSRLRRGLWRVYVSRDGALWMCIDRGGLGRLKDGKLTLYTTENGLPSNRVRTVYEDRQGSFWIGTFDQGLVKLKDGVFSHFTVRDGLAHNNVKGTLEDREGNLWIVTLGGGVSRLRNGVFTTYGVQQGLPSDKVRDVLEDHQGNLWFATVEGLARIKDGRFQNYTTRQGLSNDRTFYLCEDRHGNLWIATEGGGLVRFKDEAFSAFTSQDGLADANVKAVFEDREGSLWIGTNGGGLSRLRNKKYTVYSTRDGLSDNHVEAVYEDRSGSLWVGTINGLNRFRDSRFKTYTSAQGLPSNFITAIHEDRDGVLWLGTHSGGLTRFKDGVFKSYSKRQGLSHDLVTSLLKDREGILWVGTDGGGLNRLNGSTFSALTVKEGLGHNAILALHQDRQGALWIGTQDGLNVWDKGRLHLFGKADGLSDTAITSIHEDADGALWLGTRNGGLNRHAHGAFESFTTAHGLVENTVLQILEDDRGSLWLLGDEGISRVNKRDLVSGKRPLNVFFLEREDSGGNNLSLPPTQPVAWKSRSGSLWFSTANGLVMIDPANLQRNPMVPPVILEQLMVDRKPIGLQQTLELAPGHGDYEFHYTGLSLVEPEKVKFRYRLEGFDKDWIEAGARRVAYYTNLPFGHYRFHVTAANNDGVWNSVGAAVAFYQKPYFHQTLWFYACCLAGVALLVWGLHQQRIQRMAAQHGAVLAERNRIAGEIHDTLIQGVVGISANVELVVAELEDSPERARTLLDRLRILISNTLDEARRSVWNLRPASLEQRNLASALQDSAREATLNTPIQVKVQVDGPPRPLPGPTENNLLRIGQEAVNNAIKHSRARSVQMELHYEPAFVRLLVQDDGCGFDPQRPVSAAPDHFGLTAMRERAEKLGGRLFITSSPGEGAIIEAEIPG